MAVVTICNDFGAPKIKSPTVSTVSPSICYQVMGPDAMILVFWMLSFKPDFSLLSFTFIKRLFSSSSLSALRVVSSAYLRLLIFLPTILIPACTSSSLAFLMMYSAYKLNKQGDNIQPWYTPSPICNQTVVLCLVLTIASWSAYRFLRRQVRWSSILISLRIVFVVIHTVQGFGVVNKGEIDVFLEFSCLFYDPTDVGNLISGSCAFSKSSLNIWKFTVHILLKPGLENFEHYFASVRWAQLCGSLNILWPCPSLGLEWKLTFSSFPNLLALKKLYSSEEGTKDPWLCLMAGLSWWFSGKGSTCRCRRCGFNPWVWKNPGERNGSPLQYSCLGNLVPCRL